VKITFDPAKREATLRERGIDFLDVALVLQGVTYTKEDARFDYGERRFQTVGLPARTNGHGRVDAAGRCHACHLDEEVQ
jgi:uncharacterized DUF497 family protein